MEEKTKGGAKKKGKKGKGNEGEEKKINLAKLHGAYMESFMPFYDVKAMLPPLSEKQVEKVE